jgi:RHS repeat-associated protein
MGVVERTSSAGTYQFRRDAGGQLLGVKQPTGQRYYYLSDALGSTAAITNPAGALDNTYEYDPYGDQTASTGTLSNYFKFAGGFSLADRSGGDLYHFGARYYGPATGRWTQIDPLDLTEANRYLYVGDPINLTDPRGKFSLKGCAIGALAGAAVFGSDNPRETYAGAALGCIYGGKQPRRNVKPAPRPCFLYANPKDCQRPPIRG